MGASTVVTPGTYEAALAAEIARRLKRLRVDRSLTIVAAAALPGMVDKRHVAYLEAGRHLVTLPGLLRILGVYRYPVAEFLKFLPVPDVPQPRASPALPVPLPVPDLPSWDGRIKERLRLLVAASHKDCVAVDRAAGFASRRTWHHIHTTYLPKLPSLARLCAALGVTLADLFDGVGITAAEWPAWLEERGKKFAARTEARRARTTGHR